MSSTNIPAGASMSYSSVADRQPPTAPSAVPFAQSPLSRYEFATGSQSEAHRFVRTVYATNRAKLDSPSDGFRFESGYVQNSSFGLEYMRVTGRGQIQLRPLRTVLIVQLAQGCLDVHADLPSRRVGPGGMVLFGPNSAIDVGWENVSLNLVRLDLDALERVAADAAGRPRFDLGLAVSLPVGQAQAAHLRATIDHLRRDVLSNSSAANNVLIRRRAMDLLAAAVLNTFGNAFVLTQPLDDSPEAAPPALRRACRYIEANAQDPITIDDVARETRVSVRTLQAAFRRFLDQTPSQYISAARMAGAHDELLSRDATQGATVDEIMRRWRFSNSGRFAKLYRESYGESPRATLHR